MYLLRINERKDLTVRHWPENLITVTQIVHRLHRENGCRENSERARARFESQLPDGWISSLLNFDLGSLNISPIRTRPVEIYAPTFMLRRDVEPDLHQSNLLTKFRTDYSARIFAHVGINALFVSSW